MGILSEKIMNLIENRVIRFLNRLAYLQGIKPREKENKKDGSTPEIKPHIISVRNHKNDQ